MTTQPHHAASARPLWSTALRSLREARGVTQEGWAALLGVGYRTVQRWEQGSTPPDAAAEALLLAYCEEQGLLRPYSHGPLAGLTLTRASLSALLAEARLGALGAGADTQAGYPTAAPVPRPIGMPLTSLIGRDQELAAVAEQLRVARLVTLTGPAGTGKTRLAHAVVATHLNDAPGSAVFVALAAITSAAPAQRAINAGRRSTIAFQTVRAAS